ncbi:hypothetical protein JCM10908_005567 [Rhodotorula pacifica]|uniref:uncharacterized protein n=1 Tax=Rhodotorula pacifica TaxID=1495444 RepID=UPI00316B33C2
MAAPPPHHPPGPSDDASNASQHPIIAAYKDTATGLDVLNASLNSIVSLRYQARVLFSDRRAPTLALGGVPGLLLFTLDFIGKHIPDNASPELLLKARIPVGRLLVHPYLLTEDMSARFVFERALDERSRDHLLPGLIGCFGEVEANGPGSAIAQAPRLLRPIDLHLTTRHPLYPFHLACTPSVFPSTLRIVSVELAWDDAEKALERVFTDKRHLDESARRFGRQSVLTPEAILADSLWTLAQEGIREQARYDAYYLIRLVATIIRELTGVGLDGFFHLGGWICAIKIPSQPSDLLHPTRLTVLRGRLQAHHAAWAADTERRSNIHASAATYREAFKFVEALLQDSEQYANQVSVDPQTRVPVALATWHRYEAMLQRWQQQTPAPTAPPLTRAVTVADLWPPPRSPTQPQPGRQFVPQARASTDPQPEKGGVWRRLFKRGQ